MRYVEANDFENKLEQILDKTLPLLSKDDKCTISGKNNSANDYADIRYVYYYKFYHFII